MYPRELKGRLVTVRFLHPTFFAEYHAMFSQKVREILGLSLTAQFEETEQYLQDVLSGLEKSNALFYCIFNNTDNRLIGAVEIREKDHPQGQLGCWLNEHYWGTGRFQEALDLVIPIFFKENKEIDSFNALVVCDNQRSYHALIKYGFEEISSQALCRGKKARELVMWRGKIDKQ